jgi:tRNA A-37 threonylcarbamoyl transferase component Bud32/tetratricopeptide (TPR) repeat protein
VPTPPSNTDHPNGESHPGAPAGASIGAPVGTLSTTSNSGAPSASWFSDEQSLIGTVRLARATGRPARIPGYEDLRELRRGGQGIVYSAVQTATRQRVAIKVLLAGALATDLQRRRLEREAELAAKLYHPHIVRVFDMGVTEDGAPFIVMEFIEGRPLDEILRVGSGDDQLTRPQRIRLFRHVCEAVSFAHQRGVLHRDLKPSNIRIDQHGNAKVLDFGLAKSLENGLTADPAFTRTGGVLGSVAYASPEQLTGEESAVDVRSDVYSLGVLLYQLITNELPIDVSGSLADAVSRVRSVVPRDPTGTLAATESDLATIALTCLRKEPERRYQSVGALLEDLTHYETGEPIRAKRDSAWYTLRNRARRYRRVAWFVGAAAAGLAVLAGVAWQQRTVAVREREKFAAVDRFVQKMLASPNPSEEGREVRVVDVLDDAARSADEEFAKSKTPAVEAAVRQTLGSSYLALSRLDEAAKQLDRALVLATQAEGEESELAKKALLGVVLLKRRAGDTTNASVLGRKLLDMQLRAHGPMHADVFEAQDALAGCLEEASESAEALALRYSTADGYAKLSGDDSEDALRAIGNLSTTLISQDKFPEAKEALDAALAKAQAKTGQQYPETNAGLLIVNNLAITEKNLGNKERTEELLRYVVVASAKRWGPESEEAITTKTNLAAFLGGLGRNEEAEPILIEALEAARRRYGPVHPQTAFVTTTLGSTYRTLKRYDDAERLFRDSCAQYDQLFGGAISQQVVAAAYNNLASLLTARDRYEEARDIFEKLLPKMKAGFGDEHFLIALVTQSMGKTYAALKDDAKAEAFFIDSYNRMVKARSAEDPRTQQTAEMIADFYDARQNPAKRDEWLAKAGPRPEADAPAAPKK